MSLEMRQLVSVIFNDQLINGNIVGISDQGYTIQFENGSIFGPVSDRIIVPFVDQDDLSILESSDDEQDMPVVKMPVKKENKKSPMYGTFVSRESKYVPNTTKYAPLKVIQKLSPNKGGGRRKRKKRKRTKKRGKKTRKKKRENRKTKKLSNGKSDRCAPQKKGERLPYTCYTKTSLHKLKNLWNARHPDGKITSNDPKEIWNSLKTNMGSSCKRESCWLKHHFIKNNLDKSLLNNTFRPKRPKEWKKNPDEWLTSVDIMKFMKQYENIHKDFDFMGPSPIDYDTHLISDECVWEELCKFNLHNVIRSGKKKIGIIFNLDPHFKGGSHWVAVFINVSDKIIYYFDSYGEKIPSGIMKFVKTIQNQSGNIGKQYSFRENKKRHQYSNSECGMFSLHFIRSMILYNNWDDLTKKKISDKEMLRLRKVYYNP